MNIEPYPGEVWFAELGLAEKSRPVLVLAYPQESDARALVVVAPLTSQIRGLRGEVDLGKPTGSGRKMLIGTGAGSRETARWGQPAGCCTRCRWPELTRPGWFNGAT